ncbi:hypothetical protein [Curtobacterium sp. MCBA15_004]|uniref:hypothetical protein n=1 Tax=Curtobacterium sp. MCBA15_004 TaxID=1898733 RepID=UPI0008DE3202|nr:hypothetical protein [Curtobacterium sp. MCBA15_004]WIA97649.1 hypothetical protein QOL16_04440 [Curtobacterium sp. MCBA15_004]
MTSATLSHRADIRAARRRAAKDVRILRRNIKAAAVRLGYSTPRLAKEARVPLLRVLAIRLHLGRQITVPELFALMFAVNLDVDGLFAGTRETSA